METVPVDEEVKNEEVIIDNPPSSHRLAGTKRRGDDYEVDEDEAIVNNGKPTVAGIDKKITVPMDEYIGVLLKSEERKKMNFFCQAQGCVKSFDSIAAYTDHYLQNHMHTCGTCKRKLPGSHLLELHVLEQHDTLFSLMAERKPMYACLAEECLLKFSTPQERNNHVNEEHKHHDMFHAFKHFQNTDYGNKTQSNNKNNNNRKNKSGKSGKDVQMEVEITPASEVAGGGGHEKEVTGNEEGEAPIMEVETAEKQDKSNVQQKNSKKKNSHHPTPATTTTHITFGHHESRFQPWHTNKSQKQPVKSTTTESNKDNETSMNMNAMKESLDISITEIDK